jgi:hypothetical protein
MQDKAAALTETQLQVSKDSVDARLRLFESCRDTSQVIVHVDMVRLFSFLLFEESCSNMGGE